MDFLWVAIVMIAISVLPDILRKKRKYPVGRKGKGPIPIPERRDKNKPVKGPILQRKRKEPEPLPEEEKPRPIPQRAPEPVANPYMAAYDKVRTEQPAAVTVPKIVRPKAWGTLKSEAREIYSGLVWSELLQPPVSQRRKIR